MKTLTLEELYQQFSSEYFQELSTFGALSKEVVKRLLAEGEIFELEPGEYLYQIDSSVDELYVILSGKIALYHHHHDKLGLTHYYKPGQQIGFVGLITLHTRKGTAIANEKCCILSISTKQYYDLYRSSPEAFGILTLNLAREMARTIGEMGDLIAELRSQN
jgi:CRP-like cAMP-binding protein